MSIVSWLFFRLPRLWMGRTSYAAWIQTQSQHVARKQRKQRFEQGDY